MGTLLVHVVGESDLLLSSQSGPEEERAARIADRLARLRAVGGWDDVPVDGQGGPLFTALGAIEAEGEVDVVLVGTEQDPPHKLDTLPIACGLGDALGAGLADRVGRVDVVSIPGLTEGPVTRALGEYLRGRPTPGDGAGALVTWGSGSTSVALGCLTALSQAGIAWRLVETSGTGRVVDPLDDLGADPVAGVLVRWRMFGVLDELAGQESPPVRLSPDQLDLVGACARRSENALRTHDAAALRAVVADAVVRRDGTAGLAVRRYVESRYEELLRDDRVEAPEAKDLLEWIAGQRAQEGHFTLGARIGALTKRRADPVLATELASPSGGWLLGKDVRDLIKIGNASHEFRPPAVAVATQVGHHLRPHDVDGSGWESVGLPVPPVVPATTALVVWPLGLPGAPGRPSIGDQLLGHGVPAPVRDYLSGEAGAEPVPLRALIFGTIGDGGTLGDARAEVERLREGGLQRARAQDVDLEGLSTERLGRQIEAQLKPDVGALLLVPPGYKPLALALLRAMRRLGARHGLPLYVQDMASPGASSDGSQPAGVHLWPALTGGDLALLVAARQALESLELDVAWRLLAASGLAATDGETARRLAAAFTCRAPMDADQWPVVLPDPAPTADPVGRTLGVAAQRLALVRDVCAKTESSAERVRLLVLAAGALEVSAAASNPQGKRKENYRAYRDWLEECAGGSDRPGSARVLLLLNEARDRASITHGPADDPDHAVAQAADELAKKWPLGARERADLPRDVPGLLRAAVKAAEALHTPLPGPGEPSLATSYRGLRASIDGAIAARQRR
jgi:hypothetical protein